MASGFFSKQRVGTYLPDSGVPEGAHACSGVSRHGARAGSKSSTDSPFSADISSQEEMGKGNSQARSAQEGQGTDLYLKMGPSSRSGFVPQVISKSVRKCGCKAVDESRFLALIRKHVLVACCLSYLVTGGVVQLK